MKGERLLCEMRDEMRPAVLELGLHGDSKIVRDWATLKCPHAGGCSKSAARCDGFTAENRLRIAELKDRLFVAGFVRITEKR